MKPLLKKFLSKLQIDGEISYSEVPKSILTEFRTWGENTGAYILEKQGRGSVFRLKNQLILNVSLSENAESTTNSIRAQNLAQFANSKGRTARLNFSYALFKIQGDVAIWVEDQPLIMSNSSQIISAIQLHDHTPSWRIDGGIFLVENQSVFDDLSWLDPLWRGIVIYYQGQISARLFEFLCQSQYNSLHLFADYDGIGLDVFYRLKQHLKQSQNDALWYWGLNWQRAIEKFGNSDLWNNETQKQYIHKLRNIWEEEGFPDPNLRVLIDKMFRSGKMLEQEWVLI